MSGDREAAEPADAAPPLLGSWRNLYWLVLGVLGVNVVLLYALGWWAS